MMRWTLVFSALVLPMLRGQAFDLIIANGKIVDGAGGPWYYADIAIKGDTIAAIGKFDPKSAARVLDANSNQSVHGECTRPSAHTSSVCAHTTTASRRRPKWLNRKKLLEP